MSLSSIRTFFLLLGFISLQTAYSQDKNELQKERDKISQEISLTNKLLSETKESRSKVEGELSLLNKKIRLREDLIRSLNREVNLYNDRIARNRNEIKKLEEELETLKGQYAQMIRFAQKSNQAQDRLMYVFASEDFFQAVRRVRYLRQIAGYRKTQVAQIERTKEELQRLNSELESMITEKNTVLSKEQNEKDELTSDLQDQQSKVSTLKKEESSLVRKLREKEKQREKLNKEIQRIIEAEIRASKKDNAGVFALTPEAAALSENFEKNRGKLPWPVERGVITANFGQNPHPVLAGIMVPNNGIDIATNKNAVVRAVFEGTVSAVFSIPGAGQNVIINHGGYRSVYTKLKEVYVSKGQKINPKEAIGIVLTDEANGKTEAHLEIWKVTESGTTKQDPALWIYRQ